MPSIRRTLVNVVVQQLDLDEHSPKSLVTRAGRARMQEAGTRVSTLKL
jgi:hypothetical protein